MPSRDDRPTAIHLPSLGRDSLSGGAERVAVTLATEFVRAGRPTDLVLSVVHPGPLRDLPPEVRVVDLDSRRLWTALPGLVAYRWRERPRVMLSMMPLANTLNVLSSWFAPRDARRSVLSERAPRSIALDRGFSAEGTRLLHPLCRATYPRADLVIGCSEGVAARVRSEYPTLAPRVVGIPNPVTPAVPRGIERPHPWLGDPAVPCLIGVGRLHEAKDLPTFLATVDRVRRERPIRALLVGDGPLRAEVEAEIGRLDLVEQVELVGWVPDPRRYVAWADVLLHTAAWEGFGLVLLEALAEGVSVVATDCLSGPQEILADGAHGRLAPVGDAEALAAAVIAALDMPRDQEHLRARAAEFAPSVIARRYLEVLDAVAA